jgi:fumarate hydratase subunit alpha
LVSKRNRKRSVVKTLYAEDICKGVEQLCLECNFTLPEDVLKSLQLAEKKETHPRGKKILGYLLENAEISDKEKIPLCQDCGIGIFFVEIGQQIHVEGDLIEAIQQGMIQAYDKGYLRKSLVNDPFRRMNTETNAPAIIHTFVNPGDHLHILFAPKGAGSENCSVTKFFNPTVPKKEIEKWILDQSIQASKKACGPLIVGVGIGGSSEYCPLLAKKALFRSIGVRNSDEFVASMEQSLLHDINHYGSGPQGLGGNASVLDVFIETYPTHIAMMPVSLNFQCHSARHGRISF